MMALGEWHNNASIGCASKITEIEEWITLDDRNVGKLSGLDGSETGILAAACQPRTTALDWSLQRWPASTT